VFHTCIHPFQKLREFFELQVIRECYNCVFHPLTVSEIAIWYL
jgi:hypothetical protein